MLYEMMTFRTPMEGRSMPVSEDWVASLCLLAMSTLYVGHSMQASEDLSTYQAGVSHQERQAQHADQQGLPYVDAGRMHRCPFA